MEQKNISKQKIINLRIIACVFVLGMNGMNVCCWTVAPDGQLPKTFPVESLKQSDLFIAGIQNDPRALQANPRNFAACVNEAAQRASEKLLIFLPPDLLELADDWKAVFTEAAENSDCVFFYGNYTVRGETGDIPHTTREDIGDITEREDWGPVWAVNCEWLNQSGGLDEIHHRAAFYDLLLKSFSRRCHIDASLALIAEPPGNKDTAALKSKLFFPGRGALGGFSYLFMDKEEESHIEQVFYNFLKRQHVWLEGERSAHPPACGGDRGSDVSNSPPFRGVQDTLYTPPQAAGGQGGVKVSVITPVYNRARFIGKAIQSVQNNSFTDWEYIIVDNGSTDGTQEMVLQYAEHDSRIRLVENDQNVIALALNLGVKLARGKYISQLDSDDEYLPHTMQKMVDALDSHPTWGLAISYYELMNEAGEVLPEFGVIKHEQYNRNNILRRDGAGALRCWHRSVILEMGGFDEKELGQYGEDYDLVLKAGEKYEVGRVHEVCYRYRRHDGNTDVLRSPEMKIRNKTIARLNALDRRRLLNQA
ncbi:glycosyltransferase [bacterium]|nr:glycosyltransferase [bacterium]